jgi:hypothetical protein
VNEKFPFRLVKKKQILRFFSKMRIINLAPIISFGKFVLKDMFHRKVWMYVCVCVKCRCTTQSCFCEAKGRLTKKSVLDQPIRLTVAYTHWSETDIDVDDITVLEFVTRPFLRPDSSTVSHRIPIKHRAPIVFPLISIPNWSDEGRGSILATLL